MSTAQAFPAFPAGRRGGRAFARSWWGRAWIEAAEDAALDSEAVKNGRKYARAGRVGSITVSAGRLSAPVYDDAGTYRTTVDVQPLTDAQWDRFVGQVAARAGHIAALRDRSMPQDLIADAHDVDVPLLPGLGDLDPSCDCEDWGHPCRHAAALTCQAAWLIDEDPFLLLLLRGMDEAEFLAALQRQGRTAGPVAAAARPDAAADTVSAHAAYARSATLPPLPDDPALPVGPGRMPSLPDDSEVDTATLRLLAHDAAVRARHLLIDPAAPELTDERTDAVRLAAAYPVHSPEPPYPVHCPEPPYSVHSPEPPTNDTVRLTPEAFARLRAAHDDPADFPRAVSAWHFGGATGLAVLNGRPWTPTPTELAHARAEFTRWADDEESPYAARAFRNHDTHWTDDSSGTQLRLGPDARWYPYRAVSGTWWPAGPPAGDLPTACPEPA